jgi:GT2 family glycosyltransferase
MNYEPVTIIMPVMNQLEFTKRCVESILANSPEQFEFLIIDNASTDGTAEYLEELEKTSTLFTILRNQVNKGVSASWNQGVRAARHNIVCIINNDIEVLTQSWITQLQKTLKSNDHNRWVCPRTCYDKNKQHMYRKTHYEQLPYNWNNPDHYVVGCCFMCPKSVFTELGEFDEGFEIRYYEDLDYLARILSAGLKVQMCIYALVYHAVGTTSRKATGGDNNYKYYEQKWGKTRYKLDFWRGKSG